MNEKINIQNLTDLLAEKHGMSPEHAGDFVRTFFALIEEGLEQDKYVKVKGLGTFKLIEVGSRESIDVNTGERIEIQGHNKISFTPDTALKEIINRPFGHFETVVLNDNVQFDDTPVEKEGEDELDGDAEGEETADIQQTETQVPAEQPHEEQPEETVTEEPVTAPAAEEAAKDVLPEVKEIPVPPSPAEPEPEAEPVNAAENKGTQGNAGKWWTGIVVCILLACAGVVGYLYLPDMQHGEPEQDIEIEEVPPVRMPATTDTIPETKADTTASAKENNPGEKVEQTAATDRPSEASQKQTDRKPAAPKKQPFVPDSVNYEIDGTQTEYTIQEGETLTRVALKFYGTKALWPYLVKYNADILKNPDNVPSGTTIRIPKLVKKR